MNILRGNRAEVDNLICHIITMNWFHKRNPCDMYWPSFGLESLKNVLFNQESPLLDCKDPFFHLQHENRFGTRGDLMSDVLSERGYTFFQVLKGFDSADWV